MCKKHKSRLAGRELKKAADAIAMAERDAKKLENAKKRFQDPPKDPPQPIELKEPQHFVYLGVEFDCYSIEELMEKIGVQEESLIGYITAKKQIHVFPKTKDGVEKLLNVKIENDPIARQYLEDITNETPEELEVEKCEIRAGFLCTSSSM